MPLGTGTTNGLTTPPDVATFTTLSSLLASPPAGRATALDAPGSDLYASGGKWAGDPGRFANESDANYIAYLAAIAAGSVFPAPSVMVGTTPATAVAMRWVDSAMGYRISGDLGIVADDTAAQSLLATAANGSHCSTVAGAIWTKGA